MSRLPLLVPRSWDEDQRALFDSITGGRRGAGPQHFQLQHPDGALTGPFNAMMFAPAVSNHLSALGEAIRFETSLTARQREIAILTVAAVRRSGYEWYAHERVGRAAGLTREELTAIRRHTSAAFTDVTEAVVLDVVAILATQRHLDDRLFAAAESRLGHRALVELVILVGYYELLATVLDAFEIGVPEGAGPFDLGND